MPDRLTPSEALEEIKRRYDGRSETTSVSPETLKLPTLMLFDHVAVALARPTPGAPPPQGWEEAWNYLHNECGDKARQVSVGEMEVYQSALLERHLATLRSHLSGRETRETNKPQE